MNFWWFWTKILLNGVTYLAHSFISSNLTTKLDGMVKVIFASKLDGQSGSILKFDS